MFKYASDLIYLAARIVLVGYEKGRAESGPIRLGFLANPNPYGPAKVKPENLTEFSDAKNLYTILNQIGVKTQRIIIIFIIIIY
jgi:hypothetical protein